MVSMAKIGYFAAFVAIFLLTSEAKPDARTAHAVACGANAVPLVDRAVLGDYPALRRGLSGIRLVQVIHLEGSEFVDEAERMGQVADALLLDSGRLPQPIKELGGTGRTHEWSFSRDIVAVWHCPAFLAGGLRPDNAGQAVREVRPCGLDLCNPSGRTTGNQR